MPYKTGFTFGSSLPAVSSRPSATATPSSIARVYFSGYGSFKGGSTRDDLTFRGNNDIVGVKIIDKTKF